MKRAHLITSARRLAWPWAPWLCRKKLQNHHRLARAVATTLVLSGCTGRSDTPTAPERRGPSSSSRLPRMLVSAPEGIAVGYFYAHPPGATWPWLRCRENRCTLSPAGDTVEHRQRLCPRPNLDPPRNAYDAFGMPALPEDGCSMVYLGGGHVLSETHCVETLLCDRRGVEWSHSVVFGHEAGAVAVEGALSQFSAIDAQTIVRREPLRCDDFGPKRTPDPVSPERAAAVDRCRDIPVSEPVLRLRGLVVVDLGCGPSSRHMNDPSFSCRGPLEGESVYSLNYPGGAPLMRSGPGVVRSVHGDELMVEGVLHERGSSSAPIFAERDGALVGISVGSRHSARYCSTGEDLCTSQIACGGACGEVIAFSMTDDVCREIEQTVKERKKQRRCQTKQSNPKHSLNP